MSLLRVRDLKKHFRVGRRTVRAVDAVSFDVEPRLTLGLVGESGCGKTTLARTILRLIEPTSGTVEFEGREITALPRSQLRPLRRRMQIVFQDPYGSLNPRMRVGPLIAEGLAIHHIGSRRERRERCAELLACVGLPASAADRFPHEFSGGQRQRIGIARALAVSPRLIVADEPVSALDVSVQAQILNLLSDLQERFGLAYVFISHDLSVVKHLSHEIAVMYLGQIVERAACRELFKAPLHPYTRALLSSIPVPDPRRRLKPPLATDIAPVAVPPTGCRFAPRCPHAGPKCRTETQALAPAGPGHVVRCWRAVNSAGSVVRRTSG